MPPKVSSGYWIAYEHMYEGVYARHFFKTERERNSWIMERFGYTDHKVEGWRGFLRKVQEEKLTSKIKAQVWH